MATYINITVSGLLWHRCQLFHSLIVNRKCITSLIQVWERCEFVFMLFYIWHVCINLIRKYIPRSSWYSEHFKACFMIKVHLWKWTEQISLNGKLFQNMSWKSQCSIIEDTRYKKQRKDTYISTLYHMNIVANIEVLYFILNNQESGLKFQEETGIGEQWREESNVA